MELGAIYGNHADSPRISRTNSNNQQVFHVPRKDSGLHTLIPDQAHGHQAAEHPGSQHQAYINQR
jgi:hypothetical protein